MPDPLTRLNPALQSRWWGRATTFTPRTHPLERHGRTGALCLVALGFWLRVRGLSEYWLNPDEGIYYSTLTQASFGDFWAEVVANAHPPAFYLLLRGAGLLTWDFVWLRGLPLVFGTAAIWIFWLLGRELGGKGRGGIAAGLVAAGLLAVGGDAIAFSQVLRPYTMLIALLGGALLHLLRYRTEPTDRDLAGYVVFVSLAVLCHYSAALAFGVFAVVVAVDGLVGGVGDRDWRRLVLSQAIPATLAGALYLSHVRSTLGSDLMEQAFGPGGWLSDWLVTSPAGAWHSFVTFQNLQLPTDFQGRSALLLLAAIAASALSRDRLVAVLAGAAVSIALLASFLGVYPFGPSRHSLWLVVFTLPAVGWLVGYVVESGSRAAIVTAGALGASLLFGAQIEGMLGAYPLRGEATEERTIRRLDLAPLVVAHLGPDGEPRTILMSDQTYNVMMPLYARERRDVTVSTDSTLFSFKYGTRDVVVSTLWDWRDVEDVTRVLRSLPGSFPGLVPDSETSILLMAGGFNSELFGHLSELEDREAVLRASWATGPNPDGAPFLRLGAMVIDREAFLRQR